MPKYGEYLTVEISVNDLDLAWLGALEHAISETEKDTG